MNLKEYFDKIDLDEINRLIETHQEENLNIEFKIAVHPNETPENRHPLYYVSKI